MTKVNRFDHFAEYVTALVANTNDPEMILRPIGRDRQTVLILAPVLGETSSRAFKEKASNWEVFYVLEKSASRAREASQS
jgi:hypothetical protein